jgi:hypothetical protein
MPNRILRDGILTSARVESLGLGAEVFYRRLMSVVDDFGLFTADPTMLRAACYPRRIDRVSNADVAGWLVECSAVGLVATYIVDGESFLMVTAFRQQVRATKSKWPQPPAGCESTALLLRSGCIADAQRPKSFAHLDVDVDVCVDKAVVVCEVGSSPSSKGRNKTRATASPPLPDWLPLDAWKQWRQHKGSKLTPGAMALQLKKLEGLRAAGFDPAALIALAIESGWATFWPPKGQQQNGRGNDRASIGAEMFGSVTDGQQRTDGRDITGESERVA